MDQVSNANFFYTKSHIVKKSFEENITPLISIKNKWYNYKSLIATDSNINIILLINTNLTSFLQPC